MSTANFVNRQWRSAKKPAQEKDEHSTTNDEKRRDDPANDAHSPKKLVDGVFDVANPLFQIIYAMVAGYRSLLLFTRWR